MPTRREILRDIAILTASLLIPSYLPALKSDIDILFSSSNKLMKADVAMAVKSILMGECYSSAGGINCEIKYPENKRGTNLINKILPKLSIILQREGANKYESVISAYDKTLEIKISSLNGKNIFLSLPKSSFSSKEIKNILLLEDIIKDLSYAHPRDIQQQGYNADINCVSNGRHHIKCMFGYENVGKKAQFINKNLGRINLIDGDYYIKIKIPEGYRSIETKLYNKILNITLEAEDKS